MSHETLYEVLGIGWSATSSEIRTSYRLLAMKSHPAHNKGPEAARQFAQLSKAYSILSSAELRTQYDSHLQNSGLQANHLDVKDSHVDAGHLFIDEMHALASELADAGYDRSFIELALAEEGCPIAIAAASASGVTTPSGDLGHEQAAWKEPMSERGRTHQGQENFYGRPPNTRSGSHRGIWAILLVAFLVGASAYFFGYLPYVTAKEEEARVLAERAKAAEIAAKKAEESARAALEQMQASEARAQGAEQRAGESNQQRQRAQQSSQQQRDAMARRDAQDYARLVNLRDRCNALQQAAQNMSANAKGAFGAMATGPMATTAFQVCSEYDRALNERRYYEAAQNQLRR